MFSFSSSRFGESEFIYFLYKLLYSYYLNTLVVDSGSALGSYSSSEPSSMRSSIYSVKSI